MSKETFNLAEAFYLIEGRYPTLYDVGNLTPKDIMHYEIEYTKIEISLKDALSNYNNKETY